MIGSVYHTTHPVTDEGTLILEPKYPSANPPGGVMIVHGAGSGPTYCLDTYGGQNTRTFRIVDEGFTAIAGDNGGAQTWGNAAAMTAMSAQHSLLMSRRGVGTGKVALIGDSMGGINALNWAARNRSRVSCVIGVIPVLNPEDVRANNRGGYASLVNTAYGGSYVEASMGNAHNPVTIAQAGGFADLPILIFYGTTDEICVPAQAQAFATAVGSSCTLVPITGGHAESTYAAVNRDTVMDFLNTHNRG